MIKLIIFDLDGVLIETKDIHYKALNKALPSQFQISIEDHLSIYDGLPTIQKLKMLTEKGLDKNDIESILSKKQEYTYIGINEIEQDGSIQELIRKLKSDEFKLAVASNAVPETITQILSKLNIINDIDLVLSASDVKYSKPHPQIYLKCMTEFNISPYETLIIEDSPHGLEAAIQSGANHIMIDSPKNLTYDLIKDRISNIKPNQRVHIPNLNILIPMAGNGQRFKDFGYDLPKPLIDVMGVPMIKKVYDSIGIDANYIFIVKKEHINMYSLDKILNMMSPGCKIVSVDETTEGAACTTLLASEFINNDDKLIIANSDQYIEWNSSKFMYKMISKNYDGGILTFNDDDPKWSYAKIQNDLVTMVAEKSPISNNATVGLYYYKKGSDYVKYTKKMIEKNIKTNNEFYVCPVYNEFILDNKKISYYDVEKMMGLGTPYDLKKFLNQK